MAKRTLLLLAASLCAPVMALATESVTCPAVFPMKAASFGPTDDGWTAGPGQHDATLAGWGLTSGPPARLAALQPSDDRKGLSTWKLAPPYPDGVWVECVYADGALSLGKRLSATTGTCAAPDKRPRSGKPQPVTFVCR